MVLFTKIVNGFSRELFSQKSFILDVWQSSEYTHVLHMTLNHHKFRYMIPIKQRSNQDVFKSVCNALKIAWIYRLAGNVKWRKNIRAYFFQWWSWYDAISRKVYFQEHKSSRSQVFFKIDVCKTSAKFTGKHLCQGLFFNQTETLAQVFSREFC